jgi:5-methylcytosine-specific restriction endonuclease McrA
MQSYTLDHVTDDVLLRNLAELVGRDRIGTATLLAHIGEVDARQLYVGAGYPSMHAYCVEELRLSEDSAYKRIRAARAARQFPAIFPAVADGRLHLAAVCLLASHLTAVNSEELIEAATHRRRFEIEQFLARRFGVPESPAAIRPLPPGTPASRSIRQLAPGPVAGNRGVLPQLALSSEPGPSFPGVSDLAAGAIGADTRLSHGEVDEVLEPGGREAVSQLAPGPVAEGSSEGVGAGNEVVPGRVGVSSDLTPDNASRAERYSLKVTIDKKTHQKLRYAQALLSHAVARGDIAQVLDRALEALILQLEKQKFGATTRPRRARTSARKRYIPAYVRRAVWERDEGQCTFMSPDGKRCPARHYLEFDHIRPVARGGRATVEGMRLRCRTHNQYEAERMFGAGFMARKRQESRPAQPGAPTSANDASVTRPSEGSEKPRQPAPPGP